jgi:hypothetical protein
MPNDEVDQQITLFYCYSHEDQDLRDLLEKHLAALKRSGQVTSWHDRKIEPGMAWSAEIAENLSKANIVLLLISSSFLASDYCHEIEMKRALERHRLGETKVVPVILRPVDWGGTEFASLQALPRDGKPVTTWANIDEALRDVAEGIRRLVLSIRPIRIAVSESATSKVRFTRCQYSLEGAAPETMPTNVARDVVSMISAGSTLNLKETLLNDGVYTASPTNILSQPFELEFASDMHSVPVMLRLTAPDFEPIEQHMELVLHRERSTPLVVFFLKASTSGTGLLIKLELLMEERLITSRVLRTNLTPPKRGDGGEAEPIEESTPGPTQPRPGGWAVIMTIPLTIKFVEAYAPRAMPAGVED